MVALTFTVSCKSQVQDQHRLKFKLKSTEDSAVERTLSHFILSHSVHAAYHPVEATATSHYPKMHHPHEPVKF
jgi:hypothetical protein